MKGILAYSDEPLVSVDYIGNTASLMMGSTETTFYVITVYFGAIGIKRFRHTLPACLIADMAGITAALFFGWLLFT